MLTRAATDLGAPDLRFADLLRARRLAAGLTQQELAARAGLGVRTVRELERGRVRRPQRGTLHLLADALRLTGAAREAFVAASRRSLPDPAAQTDGATQTDSAAADPTTAHPATAHPVTPAGRRPTERSSQRDPLAMLGDPAVDRPILALPTVGRLVGRAADIVELTELVGTTGMVTLVGLGGVGKTSLALTVAHGCVDRYPGGVGYVALRAEATFEDVIADAAAVFHVARESKPHLCHPGPMLLVLDALDRAPKAAESAIAWLRSHAPALAIIATSRHPLAAPGGIDWRVEPLPGPPAEAGQRLATLRRYPAVKLFLTRLRQVRRKPVREAEAPVLAELVRRLGGLPLALEFAAARGRVLELDELLLRYGDRVLDLDDVAPGGDSLREAIAASYRLLDPASQWALRRLSVLAERWSLEIAERLLADAPFNSGVDTELVLDRLVGLGLVNVRSFGGPRFRLVDVAQRFAAEECAAAGESAAALSRLASLDDLA